MSTTQDTTSARHNLAHDLRTLADHLDELPFNQLPTPAGTARFSRHLQDPDLFLDLAENADSVETTQTHDGLYLIAVEQYGQQIEVRFQILLQEVRASLTDEDRDRIARLFPELTVAPLAQVA